jgi:hypothetical protein
MDPVILAFLAPAVPRVVTKPKEATGRVLRETGLILKDVAIGSVILLHFLALSVVCIVA